jgi:hypothetical protein
LKLIGSDDVLAPLATDKLLEVLEGTGAGGVVSILGYYGDEREIRFDGAAIGAARPELLQDPLPVVIRRTISGTSQTLYRRAAIAAAGGCDPRIFAEDFSLALRVAERAPLALLDVVTSFGPAGDTDRIMVGRAHQTFHDYNLALYYFLRDHPALLPRLGRLAFHRAAGRAWNWARRHGGAGWGSPYFRLNLMSYLAWGPDPLAGIRRSLGAFALGAAAAARPLVYPAPLPTEIR